ncbi:MAG: enoyl-CoA hydratase-related protein [Acidimicrobiales bacterium]|nr:enoyl-CoA hydratase-related protein [Acidimicrobiales bacterium]
MSLLTVDVADRVAVLTLDDPDRRNVVSNALNGEIVAAMDDLEDRPDVGAVVVTGAGSAFCAGGDLDDLAGCSSTAELEAIYAGFLRIAESPLPTVAAVNGPAVGAGMNMALACDVIVAADSARFDTRFLQIGIHPGGGHTWRLRRVTDHQTVMAMVVFGQVVDGRRAAEIGLAWECVDDGDLLARAVEIAGGAAAAPPALVRRTKATVRSLGGIDTGADAVAAEVGPQFESMGQPAFTDLLARLRARIKS